MEEVEVEQCHIIAHTDIGHHTIDVALMETTYHNTMAKTVTGMEHFDITRRHNRIKFKMKP